MSVQYAPRRKFLRNRISSGKVENSTLPLVSRIEGLELGALNLRPTSAITSYAYTPLPEYWPRDECVANNVTPGVGPRVLSSKCALPHHVCCTITSKMKHDFRCLHTSFNIFPHPITHIPLRNGGTIDPNTPARSHPHHRFHGVFHSIPSQTTYITSLCPSSPLTLVPICWGGRIRFPSDFGSRRELEVPAFPVGSCPNALPADFVRCLVDKDPV